jgi:hypothetical protein
MFEPFSGQEVSNISLQMASKGLIYSVVLDGEDGKDSESNSESAGFLSPITFERSRRRLLWPGIANIVGLLISLSLFTTATSRYRKALVLEASSEPINTR